MNLGSQVYYIISANVTNFGLRLTAAVPNEYMIGVCFEKLIPVFACVAALIVLVLIVASYTIIRNRKPLSLISAHTGQESGLSAIGNTLTRLSENVDVLQEKLNQQRRQMLFLSLIHGFSMSDDEMELQLKEAGINMDGILCDMRGWYMLITGFYEYSNETLIASSLKAYEEIGKQGEIIPLIIEKPELISFIYSGESTQKLFEVYKNLNTKFNLQVHFYLGEPFDRVSKACLSFKQARKHLNSDPAPVDNYLTGTDAVVNNDVFDYGHKTEDRIINLIENGHKEELKQAINEVYEVNFCKNSLCAPMREQLYWRMLSSFTRCSCRLGITNTQLMNPDSETSPEEFFKLFCEHALQLSDETAKQRDNAQNTVDEQMISYVDENFRDCNLSIAVLAMKFGHSEPYTSNRFKLKSGMVFSTYLEQKRIEEAKLLLKYNDSSIAETGEKVGYASSTAFGRAFKRVVGCTPGEYKASGIGNEKTQSQ